MVRSGRERRHCWGMGVVLRGDLRIQVRGGGDKRSTDSTQHTAHSTEQPVQNIHHTTSHSTQFVS